MHVHLHVLHSFSELSDEDDKEGILENSNVGLLETFIFLFLYLFRQSPSLLAVPKVYTTQNMCHVESFDWHVRQFNSQKSIQETIF